MNPHTIKRLFPNASKSLLEANAHEYGTGYPDTDRQAQGAKPQRSIPHRAVGTGAGEESHPGRCRISVVSRRRRLIDPDNLTPKFFIDALRYAGVITDDSAKHVEYSIRQEKVATKEQEHTEITITKL